MGEIPVPVAVQGIPRASLPDEGLCVVAAATTLNLNVELLKALVGLLGGDEATTLTEFFVIPSADVEAAIGRLTVRDSSLTPLQKGALIRGIRLLASIASVEIPALGAPLPTSASKVAAVGQLGSSSETGIADTQRSTDAVRAKKRKFHQVLQAGDEREFLPLPAPKLRKLRAEFESANGSAAREFEIASEDQLSSLAAKLAVDEVPYADFSVFGPFGKRLMRMMSCRAQVFVEGELVSKALEGPRDFEQWRKCWRVFRNAMLTLNASLPGPLDDYEEGIRQMTRSFPNHWSHIAVIEDQMRSERWEALRGKIETLVERSQFRGSFCAERPWEAVLSVSTYGSGDDQWWWNTRVDKPCMQSASVQGAAGRLAEVEGSNPASVSSLPQATSRTIEAPVRVRNDTDPSKRDRYNQRRQESISSGRRPDGRYLVDGQQKELCFAWNRSHTGCGDQCVANPPRVHACEWCLGVHRAVDDGCSAPRRPSNWRPEPAKGKGRGKRK